MVDYSIATQVRPFQMPNIGEIYGQAQNIQMNRMRMAEAQETAQERNALRGLLSSGVDLNTPEGLNQLRRTAPMLAPQFEQAASQRAYQAAQAGRLRAQTQADQIKTARDLLSGVSNQAQWDAWRRSTVAALPEYADAIPTQFSPQNVQRVAEGADGLIRRASEATAAARPTEFDRALRAANILPGTPEYVDAYRARAASLTGGRQPRLQVSVVEGLPMITDLDTGQSYFTQVVPGGGAPRAAAPVDLRRPQATAPAAPPPANMMLPGAAASTLAAGPNAVPSVSAAAPTTIEAAAAARDLRAVTQAGATAEAEARGRATAPPAPRQDFRYTPDFQGVEPIPGSPTATSQERRRESEVRAGNVVMREIDRALELADTARLPTAGLPGAVLSAVPGTAAFDVRALLDTVRANVGFQQLNQMRQESPTGGALGNVTVREIEFLQAALGNLSQAQSPAQFRQNLLNLRAAFDEVIHGSQGGAGAPAPPAAAAPSRDQTPGPRRGAAPLAPAAGAAPTLEQFLGAARRSNPGVSDQQLTDYYNRTYGGR